MSDLTPEKLAELEALAEAATARSPWRWADDPEQDADYNTILDADSFIVANCNEQNGRYIAAANPATVLALVRAVRDYQRRIRLALREFAPYSVPENPQDDDEWYYHVIRLLDDRFALVPGGEQEASASEMKEDNHG